MKIIQKDIFFHEINVDNICDKVVILDIDGTLVCSSKKEIDEKVIRTIRSLQKKNKVYIFSNNRNQERSKEIARNLNLSYIKAPYKKPNKKIIDYINETKSVIIIGDKYLIDGLFSQFIKAEHIKVKRYQCASDSLLDKAACFLDDAIYNLAQLLRVIK